MDFGATPYLIPYLLMSFFWMLATHRQVLFWIYLWQLKEYHLGRFLDHFSTAKGRSLFLNPLFLIKAAMLIFGAGLFFYSIFGAGGFTQKSYYNFGAGSNGAIVLFIGLVFLIFAAHAARAALGMLKMNLLRPVITKKSLLLLACGQILLFIWVILIFNMFLGEMSLPDFALAAYMLLLADVLLPLIIGAIVLALQSITDWEKIKILKKAEFVISSRSGLLVIGVAGSYGKSVTKELLASVLSQKFKVLKTPANLNTEVGVAQTIISGLKPEHQIFVCEIGAVHKGRIKQVGNAVKPKISVLTGINQQHMAVFGSQQAIIDGKFEILEVLGQEGIAVLNWESKLVCENFEAQKSKIKTKNIILAGKDIRAGEIKITINHLSLIVDYGNEKFALNTNARGGYMVEPILLAFAGAIAAGMSFEEIAKILNETDFTPFNIKTFKNSLGINILDSTYSANPDGVAAHLDYLKLWPGKKAIIMPCLIELGKASKEAHFQIGRKIAQTCDLAIIATRDRFNEIKSGAVESGMMPDNIVFLENPQLIKQKIALIVKSGDTILLEGRLPKSIIASLK